MTNKTTTLSRELAQETATLIIRDICEYEPDDNPESLCITVKALELILLQRLDDVSAALADPVPPAVAEPRLLPRRDESIGTAERDDYANGYRHAWNAACDAWEPHVTRLQAEVKRLDLMVSQADYNYDEDRAQFQRQVADLQAELTKARELFTDLKESTARSLPDHLYSRIYEFLANQSAPADKGPLSELEVLRETVKELEDMRDARVDAKLARGEPVAFTAVGVLRDDGDGGLEPEWILEGGTAELWAGAVLLVADDDQELCAEDGHCELYREQPAPADKYAFDKGAALESLAKQIYESWQSQPGYLPWVNGGNSLKQDEARHIARRTFELAMANQGKE